MAPELETIGQPPAILGKALQGDQQVLQQMASALRRSAVELEQATIGHRRAEDALHLLAAVGETLSTTPDRNAGLEKVAGLFCATLADWCCIVLRGGSDASERRFLAHREPEKLAALGACIGSRPDTSNPQPALLRLPASGHSELFAEVHPTLLSDLGCAPDERDALRAAGLQSLMAVPLVIDGKGLGSVILACGSSRRPFDLADVTVAEQAARLCALAVENGRLRGELRSGQIRDDRSRRCSMAEHEVCAALLESPSLEAAAPRILRTLGENLGWDRGILWIADRNANALKACASWQASSATTPPEGAGLASSDANRVLASGRPAWVNAVDSPIGGGPSSENRSRGGLALLPIVGKTGTLGVLQFWGEVGAAPDAPLSQTLATLGQLIGQYAERQWAEDVVRELSTPVLPIEDHLLLLPAIGRLTADRARGLTDALLRAIHESQARAVVIDLTGMASFDSQVVAHLMRVSRAAAFMGATVTFTGISARAALLMVQTGLDLRGIRAEPDLRSGIEAARRALTPPSEASGGALPGR